MLKKKKNIVDHGMIAGDWLLQNGFLFLPLELKKFDLNFDLFVCLFVCCGQNEMVQGISNRTIPTVRICPIWCVSSTNELAPKLIGGL